MSSFVHHKVPKAQAELGIQIWDSDSLPMQLQYEIVCWWLDTSIQRLKAILAYPQPKALEYIRGKVYVEITGVFGYRLLWASD